MLSLWRRRAIRRAQRPSFAQRDHRLASDRDDAGGLSVLGRIAPLVGLPPAHFDELYRTPVRWAETGDIGLLNVEKRLHVAERALLVRQAFLLPAGAAPEDVARRGDRWTYAVFLAALLHQLDGAEAPCKRGEDWAEQAFAALPGSGHRWLADEPDLFGMLAATFGGRFEDSGILGTVLAKANPEILQGSSSDPLSSAVDLEAQLAKLSDLPRVLRRLVAGGQLRINDDDPQAWVTTNDFWLKLGGGLDLVRDWLVSESEQLAPTNNQIMDALLRHDLCLAASDKDQTLWRMAVSNRGKTKTEMLVRFPIGLIWADPCDRPPTFTGRIEQPSSRKS